MNGEFGLDLIPFAVSAGVFLWPGLYRAYIDRRLASVEDADAKAEAAALIEWGIYLATRPASVLLSVATWAQAGRRAGDPAYVIALAAGIVLLFAVLWRTAALDFADCSPGCSPNGRKRRDLVDWLTLMALLLPAATPFLPR